MKPWQYKIIDARDNREITSGDVAEDWPRLPVKGEKLRLHRRVEVMQVIFDPDERLATLQVW